MPLSAGEINVTKTVNNILFSRDSSTQTNKQNMFAISNYRVFTIKWNKVAMSRAD